MSADETKTIKQKLVDIEAKHTNLIFANALADLAVKAVVEGSTSDAWREYMIQIVGTDAPRQLARLTLQDEQKDEPYVRTNVAYIVSNAICGAGTTLPTSGRVTNIDEGVPPEKFVAPPPPA
ncbi:MAG TPA: hypothetical protein VE262_06895 [Blastocatellia bacterium]|nr:hypothetical protein [Blastocatellia bacterium]